MKLLQLKFRKIIVTIFNSHNYREKVIGSITAVAKGLEIDLEIFFLEIISKNLMTNW